jgi:hypothetical protein
MGRLLKVGTGVGCELFVPLGFLNDGRYTGAATVEQTDSGSKPPGKAGVRAKDEVKIAFDVRLAS